MPFSQTTRVGFRFTGLPAACNTLDVMTDRHTNGRVQALPALAAVAALLALPGAALAARTDVVILKNGDHITGEIKKLDSGRLEYKTDDMDNVYIEWDGIRHVTSVNRFEVVDTRGIRRWGSLGRTEAPEELVVMTSVGADTLDLLSVVRLTRIKDTFLRRLKGSVSAGFSYTRATDTAEGTLEGQTNYRGERYKGGLSYSMYITQQSGDRTSRYSFGFKAGRFLKRRWTIGGNIGLEHNEELALDKRASITGTGSRVIFETIKTMIEVSVGVSGTRETYIGSDSTSYNIELPLAFDYSRYVWHHPKSKVIFSTSFYPNLTTEGRYRASVNLDLVHEIYKDLHFVIGFYFDYDSRPPEDAAKDDYRLTTSLRYTFG